MSQRAPPAIFIADSVGLDFLNSVARPVDTPVDWIADGEGFLDWLAQAELVPGEVLARIRAQARPGELDEVADEARRLREGLRKFVLDHKGRPLPPTALRELKPLNRLLERDEMFSQLSSGSPDAGRGLELVTIRRWRGAESLLLPVGEALARFVSTENFSDVKACEGPTCTLLFADHTRGKARRWCSMAICGNRAKQAAHRDRLRALR